VEEQSRHRLIVAGGTMAHRAPAFMGLLVGALPNRPTPCLRAVTLSRCRAAGG